MSKVQSMIVKRCQSAQSVCESTHLLLSPQRSGVTRNVYWRGPEAIERLEEGNREVYPPLQLTIGSLEERRKLHRTRPKTGFVHFKIERTHLMVKICILWNFHDT